LQKNFEKDLQKEFAKKQNMWCKRGPKCYKLETILAYLVSIYIGSIPSNLYTYIMQTSSIMLASITKKGEIERELGLHLVPN
jgi:hypothetical protein